jgi:hypothetical protein
MHNARPVLSSVSVGSRVNLRVLHMGRTAEAERERDWRGVDHEGYSLARVFRSTHTGVCAVRRCEDGD